MSKRLELWGCTCGRNYETEAEADRCYSNDAVRDKRQRLLDRMYDCLDVLTNEGLSDVVEFAEQYTIV